MPKSPRFVSKAATWLDRQPLPLVVVVGVILGLGIGLPGFFGLYSRVWALLWGGLVVALWLLARSTAPVFDEPPPTVARPKRVRDGPLVMIDLPGGSFRMGSLDTDEMARDDEKPAHLAEVTGFRMAVTPVTAGLYAEVVQIETPPDIENSCQQSMSPGTTPSSFAIGYPEGRGIDGATGNTSGAGSAIGSLTAIVCQPKPSGNTPAERDHDALLVRG